MTHFSLLDLAPIPEGATPGVALRNSLDLAQHAERWGYERYWVAEHHNMPGIASAATSVVIGYLAGGTKSIRVGSGGVMLPNHSPLVIAEQFGTLDAMYPGRIDLGLGRAPGTDQRTARALRRDAMTAADRFPTDVMELQTLLGPSRPMQVVHAVPGSGSEVPIWLLGSSLFSAQLAGELGMPYSFASHFAPELLLQALNVYRTSFQPSERLARPYAMPAIPFIVADTDNEALKLVTSQAQSTINLIRGNPGRLPAPVDDINRVLSPQEQAHFAQRQRYAVIGAPETAAAKLAEFIALTQPDEIMITAAIYDHQARLHSFELAAEILKAA